MRVAPSCSTAALLPLLLLLTACGEDADARRSQASDLVQRAQAQMEAAQQGVERQVADTADARFERADALLAEAEEADPSWAEPAYLRGQIDYERSRAAYVPAAALPWTEQALEHVEEALARDGEHARALALRGTTRYWRYHLKAGGSQAAQAKLLTDARSDLERAVRIDTTLTSAFTTLAHLYSVTDGARASAEAARQAQKSDDRQAHADVVMWRLFTSAYDRNRPDEASRWCEAGRERFPEVFRFSACGIHLMTMKGVLPDVERAWRLLAEVDSLSPPSRQRIDHAEALLFVGGVIARAGLPDSARAVFERARAETPAEADPHQMAYVESAMRLLAGDRDEARSLFEFYVESVPEPIASNARNHWWWDDLRRNPASTRASDAAEAPGFAGA